MAIGSYLSHRVTLIRRVGLLEDGEPVLDEDGHAERTERRVPGIAAAIQPLSARERAAQHQAGVTVGTHRIFALERSITTADVIEHDPTTCPMPTARDLPHELYELSARKDAAGVGHHLELDATVVGPSIAAAPAGGPPGSGSGS